MKNGGVPRAMKIISGPFTPPSGRTLPTTSAT